MHIAEKFDVDKECEKKETHMKSPFTIKKLNDLEELELTSAHEDIIKKTPFTVFKGLGQVQYASSVVGDIVVTLVSRRKQ